LEKTSPLYWMAKQFQSSRSKTLEREFKMNRAGQTMLYPTVYSTKSSKALPTMVLNLPRFFQKTYPESMWDEVIRYGSCAGTSVRFVPSNERKSLF
jgi:hypothetical protein